MCNVTKNGNVGILAKKEILCASIQRKYKLRNEPNKHERKELQKTGVQSQLLKLLQTVL